VTSFQTACTGRMFSSALLLWVAVWTIEVVSGQQSLSLEWYRPADGNWISDSWIVSGDNSTIFCCPNATTPTFIGSSGASFAVTIDKPVQVYNLTLGRTENIDFVERLVLSGGDSSTAPLLTVSTQMNVGSRGTLSGRGNIRTPLLYNNGFIVDATSYVSQLTIIGNYDSGPLASIACTVESSESFTQLEVQGQAHLDGKLSIIFQDTFSPEDNLTLPLITYQSMSGNFTSVEVFDSVLLNPRKCKIFQEWASNSIQIRVSECGAAPKSNKPLSGTGLIVIIVLAAVAGVAIIVVIVLLTIRVKRGYIC